MPRIITNFLLTLICLSSCHAFSYSGVFNLNSVFPPDINKYPILFLKKFTETNGPGIVKDDKPKKVNKRIQKYINSCPEFENRLISESALDTFSMTTYKYVVELGCLEFDDIPDAVAGGYNRVFKSVFYFKDRQTGKYYNGYYDPRPHQNETDIPALPLRAPVDKDFFKDLCNYIKSLNKYGAEETIAREDKRIKRYFGD